MAPKETLWRFAEAYIMRLIRFFNCFNREDQDQTDASGAIRFNKPASYRFIQVRGLQLSALLFGLVAFGSSIVLSGCGGITANTNAKTGASSGSTGNLTLSPNAAAFGSVTVGSSATTKITLTNATSNAVAVSALTLSNATFTADGLGTLPATIPANGSATVNVHFAPTATGSVSGQLVITDNSLTTPTLTVQLSGTGTQSTTAPVAALTVNASTIAFGNVPVGTPATQSVTLTSTGTAAVTVNSAAVTGAGFTVSGTTFPLTLNPSQTATLSLQFQPPGAGVDTGTLTITSNAASNGAAAVSLSGTGVPLAVALNWTPPSSSSSTITGYNVYRTISTSSSFQKLNASINSPASYTDTSVQASTTYEYYVTSVDTTGAESTPSNTATVVIP